jgi:hypothetical protein
MPSLVIKDFSGGMTDYYVEGNPTKNRVMENVVISRNAKPVVRAGFRTGTSGSRTGAGTGRVGGLVFVAGRTYMAQDDDLRDYTGGGTWASVRAVTGSYETFYGANSESTYSFAEWNGHLITTSDALTHKPRRVFYDDDASAVRMHNVGLPEPACVITNNEVLMTGTGSPATFSYIYALMWFREWETGGIVFQEFGPAVYFQVTGLEEIGVSTNQVSILPASGSWPTLTNDGVNVYDRASIPACELRFYRTEANGTVLKFVDTVTPGSTSSFVDANDDDALGAELYTAGGAVEYHPPPICKYLTIANDIIWYAHVIESDGVTRPYRVRQAVQGAPGGCPEDFYTDVDGEITGIGAVGNYPIVFTSSRVWRLEGYVDSLGAGFTKKVLVTDQVGCISDQSIVQTKDGLFFAGDDGFYFTDGFRTQLVSGDLSKETYARITGAGDSVTAAVRKARMRGAYDRFENRVYWAVQDDDASTENDALLCLDLNFGISATSTFTKFTGGYRSNGTTLNLQPCSLAFDGRQFYVGLENGYLLYQDPTFNYDEVVSTSSTTWNRQTIVYDIQSCSYNFGIDDGAKYVTKLQVAVANCEADVSMGIWSCNDNRDEWYELKPILYRSDLTWGDTDVVWGDPDYVWGGEVRAKLVERRFPRGSLRCNHKQLRFTNANSAIIKSDDYGLGTVSSPTVTIVDSVEAGLAGVLDGMTMHFEWDDYEHGYTISSVSGTTVTLTGTLTGLRAGDWKWVIRGQRVGSGLALDGYSIQWAPFGNRLTGFQTGEDGENA